MNALYCIHAISWQGIALQVRWCPTWCSIIGHLEIQSENSVPLSITETGYRSHFIRPEHVEAEGRPVAYALAWLGLTPKQHSTGGKAQLGRTSKMGQRDSRRLLIIGASAVVTWAARKGPAKGSWLARMMMTKKPRMVVALANKMARIVWALTVRETTYRAPAAA